MATNWLWLVAILEKVGLVAFIISFINGSILIFLTLFGVRQVFGSYKYLIVAFTGLGLVLGALETFFHPSFHFYHNGFVYFTLSKPFDFSKGVLKLFLVSNAVAYIFTISLLSVQFVYRYWAVFSPRNFKYFQGKKSLVWVVYFFLFGGTWTVGVIYLLDMDEISANYFREEMHQSYNVYPEEINMMTFLAFDPVDGSIRYLDCLYTVQVTGIMGIQYGIMIYCGWMMNSKMEEKIKNFSENLRHHHRQLFRALVFQITVPTIFLFSPSVIMLFLPYFQTDISFPAGLVICAFGFFPTTDSIIALYVVTEYRNSAKRIWNKLFKKPEQNQLPTASISNVTLSLNSIQLAQAAARSWN